MKNNDFIKELGYLGFTTRLKRISDALMHDGRRLYKSLEVEIEPNWFVIFKLLESNKKMTVTEIADSVKMAHPSVITITNKMLEKGFLISEKCNNDSRKRELSLSKKSIKNLPKYEKIWNAGIKAMEDVLKDIKGLEFIEAIEDKFQDKGFKNRTLKLLNK